MQSETVKKIIDTENTILAEQERVRRELEDRLQRLRDESEQHYLQRRRQLQIQRQEFLERIENMADAEAKAILSEAEKLAEHLDAIDDETLKRCIAAHLNLLLPGIAHDRQDGQG